MPVVVGLMLAIFLAALDQTIVSVALPRMSEELQGFDMLAWVVSAYLVASTVMTPIYGKLSDLYGRRAMLSLAIVIFLLASAACALAESMPMLVLGRVLQGLGGGGLLSTAQAAIADVVTPRERGSYQGYISAAYATANVVGPVVGGLFTHYLDWRWIFWINLPLGAAAFVVSRRALSVLPVPGLRKRIDYVGAALLIAGLTLLLVAISRVGESYAWNSVLNLQFFAGAVFVLAVFFWHETRTPEPILPMDIFSSRVFSLCCVIVFIGFGQVVALTILLPMRMQMLLGMTPNDAAIQLIPLTLATPFAAFISGRWMSATGRTRQIEFVGAGVALAGIVGLALIDPELRWPVLIALCAAGFGIGLQFPVALVSIQNSVSPDKLGSATAANAFFRSLGGAISIAVVSSVLLSSLHKAVPGVNIQGGEMMREVIGGSMAHASSAQMLALREAAGGAFSIVFLLLASMTVISLAAVYAQPETVLRGRLEPQPVE
ncbi:MAG: MFS transporter [Candidatus Protistobacter heckmanni]|nr:MFS transporter [Candidatus Protistobacter heckmanni]